MERGALLQTTQIVQNDPARQSQTNQWRQTMDAIQLIEQKARDKNVSMAKVCRDLGLRQFYISRWKKSKPTALKYVDRINQYLDGINK